jgi:hypothetical protein
MADSRTTPALLRWPGFVFLTALVAYFALCGHTTLKQNATPFGRDHYWASWLGSWWMFTYRSDTHKAIELEQQVDGQWLPVDEAALFPTRWESGLRFERPYFRQVPQLTAMLAHATCRRLERAGGRPAMVRVSEARWRKTLGQVEQPRANVKLTELLVLPCDTKVPLPGGRRL